MRSSVIPKTKEKTDVEEIDETAEQHEASTEPEGERLQIQYVPLGEAVLWDENPKRHDLGAIAASIRKHGFRDAPIFDSTLGMIPAGNGRIETLQWMKRNGEEAPRGILVRQLDGEWFVPIQFGIDATTPQDAVAFGVDHNNLTLMGGDLNLFDISKIWDETYPERVAQWAAAGAEFASLDGDDIEALSRIGMQFQDQLTDDDDSTDKELSHILKIEITNLEATEDVADAVRGLISEHPEWQAQIKK